MQADRRPSEAEPRQPLDSRVVGKNLVLARHDRLVVGLVRVVRNVEKVSAEVCKAVVLADRIGEVFAAQRESQLEVGFHAPLILSVKAQVVKSNRLTGLRREALEVNAPISVKEVR